MAVVKESFNDLHRDHQDRMGRAYVSCVRMRFWWHACIVSAKVMAPYVFKVRVYRECVTMRERDTGLIGNQTRKWKNICDTSCVCRRRPRRMKILDSALCVPLLTYEYVIAIPPSCD